MVKDIKYIIKRVLIGIGIAIALMWLKGGLIADVHAAGTNYTIYFRNTSNSAYNTSCNTSTFCNVSGVFNRISVVSNNNILQNGGKYELAATIIVGINRNSTCTSSNFGLRNDFYIGNTQQNSWINPTTIWNHVDDINVGNNGYCNYTWGSVQQFTSTLSSNGFVYDFYFTEPTNINYINISRFDLTNTGDTTSDAINNMTNQIINNQNTNNQTIINNQNENTQQIINNQNANTDKEIESQKVCNYIDKGDISSNNYYLNSNGVLTSSSYFGVTDYIKIDNNSEIKVVSDLSNSAVYYCFYDINKTIISCSSMNTLVLNSNLTIPSNSSYFRSTINKESNRPTYNICKNGNQALNDSINETNDTLKDSSVDDPSSDIDSMKNKLASNGVITQLITLPVTLYQSVLNNINGSCSTFNLGTLYNHNLTLPCIQPENYLGSSLWGVIDVLCCGLFILSFRKKMVDIFNHMSSLKDGGNELE